MGEEVFSVAEFIADAARAAGYDAASRGCTLNVGEVDPFLGVCGHRAKILAALADILQNAFKFTHPRTARPPGVRCRTDTSQGGAHRPRMNIEPSETPAADASARGRIMIRHWQRTPRHAAAVAG
jgi:hypothetical protein